jgi:CRISPR-associated endoribonuclease Cas6
MRLRIYLETEKMVRVPIDHHNQMRGVIYRLLGVSDATFAQHIHDEGYGEGERKLKYFTFSLLRVPRSLRRLEPRTDTLAIAPGRVEWWISSPMEDFLHHEVQGLLASGQMLQVGTASFRVTGVEAHPTPTFANSARFVCLTPIIASLPDPDGRSTARYLTHEQPEAFSEAVRHNLLRKHEFLHGTPPEDTSLTLTFDPDYIAAHRTTKLRKIREICVRGVEAPFTLEGSPALIQTAWECGLGEKTGCGFGMIDISTKG